MRYLSLPAALLLTLSATGPAPAQTPQWEATAAPVSQQDGSAHCLMVGRQGPTEVGFYAAAPDIGFVVVNAPALRGRASDIEMELGVGDFFDTHSWNRGKDGHYVTALAPGSVPGYLEAMSLYELWILPDSARLRLRDGDNDLVQVSLAGVSVAVEVMFGCIPQLPDS